MANTAGNELSQREHCQGTDWPNGPPSPQSGPRSQSLRRVSLSRLTALFGDSAVTLRDCQETVG
jgi:hypothetical protein